MLNGRALFTFEVLTVRRMESSAENSWRSRWAEPTTRNAQTQTAIVTYGGRMETCAVDDQTRWREWNQPPDKLPSTISDSPAVCVFELTRAEAKALQ